MSRSASSRDLFSAECVADPYPAYAWFREHAPVQCLTQPDGLEIWFVSAYEHARAALADPRLAHHLGHARGAMARAGIELSEDRIAFNAAHLVHSDPPDHTRLRGLVNRAFTPVRVERLRPRVQDITDRLLDAIECRTEVDLVEALNHPLPVMVICELLGVPSEDRGTFRVWSEAAVTPDYAKDAPLTKAEGNARLREYLAALVGRRREELRDVASSDEQPDLLRALVAACDDEGRLTESEVVAMTYILLIAGHESTVNFLGNAMLALLRAPELFRQLRDSPELIRHAVDEFLRYDGPVQRSTLRTATQDVKIGDVTVPSGGVVSVGLAAANRDPGQFPRADTLDLSRSENSHLAFGHGPHYCIGASLARMEGEIVIGGLVRRFSHVSLAVPFQQLRWRQTFQRGLVALPVTVGRAER